jgi:hypothetical protein
MKGNTKVTKTSGSGDTILIPELEEAAAQYAPRGWSEEEIDLLKKYYGRVPIYLLTKHLPKKTKYAVQSKAQMIGLTKRKP